MVELARRVVTSSLRETEASSSELLSVRPDIHEVFLLDGGDDLRIGHESFQSAGVPDVSNYGDAFAAGERAIDFIDVRRIAIDVGRPSRDDRLAAVEHDLPLQKRVHREGGRGAVGFDGVVDRLQGLCLDWA